MPEESKKQGEQEQAKTPDEKLAVEIIEALLKAKLVDAKKAGSLKKKLAAGTLKQDDWRGLVEFRKPETEGASDDKAAD